MSPYNPDSEEALEYEAITLLRSLGWQTANCYDETPAACPITGRQATSEVVLLPRLRAALQRLNPDLPPEAIETAIEELTRARHTLSLVQANREVHALLKEGVRVRYRDADGHDQVETVQVIAWDDSDGTRNDYFLASQLWVAGEMYTRRADLVGFINGLPLLFIELKNDHRRLEDAFKGNLRDYKATIPPLFWYNAFIILSNGRESRIGTITSGWEHFSDWKKINSEGEEGVISLDTMLRGTCDPLRLLDLTENFILFAELRGEPTKLLAKNHQYLGVNSAIAAVQSLQENQGRLGVFWHTQGSGKSFSMVFFSQKVLRTLPGNWTFLLVTDRAELDDQLYKTFAGTGAVIEDEKRVRAQSGEHLKQLLREDHRYLFTLIQKFRTEQGELYPLLSERRDIIVMADEAHRSQYDTFALNMRRGLPNAAFIGFTGTPLLAGEEKTRQVFGEYVSIYNFRQSVEDAATVPLYYENRIPELQLATEALDEEIGRVLEEAELDDAAERRLEREFARQYHLITRDDRLETIARDLVAHFLGRGYQGKAMFVAIDKLTAVSMYDKVHRAWEEVTLHTLAALRAAEASGVEAVEQEALRARLRYLQETDMAVVVSQSQNEIADFAKKGLDIATHRRRIVTEDLDTKFKDPEHPLRLVFVCAMWITGFDAPTCSTIYLDKPMRNHTLMQTIARANRVYQDKASGLIVDYIGVFRNLQQALAIYGSATGGGVQPGDLPVEDKTALVEPLRAAIGEAGAFCTSLGINLDEIAAARGFARIALKENAADALLAGDETTQKYLALARRVDRLYKALLPHEAASEFRPLHQVLMVLVERLLVELPDPDIFGVQAGVERLLDEAIQAEDYVIPDPPRQLVNLSEIDFKALEAQFASGTKKHIEAQRLRTLIERQLAQMVRRNRTRLSYQNAFEELIQQYNEGAHNVEIFFAELLAFAQALSEEDQRAIAEQLDEEELAVFDLLTRPEINLTEDERRAVKTVAHELLDTLKREKLVLDWRKRQQARAAVQLAIRDVLDKLPERYDQALYEAKCEAIYQHIFEAYQGAGRSVYARAG